uniref:Si:ch1073-266p11.2 n=1 Tax=Gouania willdenowi TaxID=441366 RepID=A0A8C5GLE1_GOUWI
KNSSFFSLELLVECIQLEKNYQVSDKLAVGVRLLDFPTLLIQPQQQKKNCSSKLTQQQNGTHLFNTGKCCVFKINLNSLHIHLSNTPIYAMLLDVKEDTPRLLGSCLIPLGRATHRIIQDVAQRGHSCPSCHREQSLVAVCSLTEEKIGSISLSYKLSYLGESLLAHITERTSVSEGQEVQECVKEDNKSTSLLPPDSGDTVGLMLDKQNIEIKKDKQDGGDEGGVALVMDGKSTNQGGNIFEDDPTIFCPPQLYYTNTGEETHRMKEERDFNLLDWDEFSDQEVNDDNDVVENVRFPLRDQAENKGVAPNVPKGQTLQQMPILRALFAELSRLNGPNIDQPLALHPISRPSSTKPPDGHQNKKVHLLSPRNCSTPVVSSRINTTPKLVEVLIKNKETSSKPSRQKLVYGTTKTFNLRMKKNLPMKSNPRPCVDLVRNKNRVLATTTKTKNKSICNTLKSGPRKKSSLNLSQRRHEDVESVMRTLTVDSAQQGTITVKEEGIALEISPTERGLECIHIPSMDRNSVPQREGREDREQPPSDTHQWQQTFSREESPSGASCRQSSLKLGLSDSSRDRNNEEDYDDDFNSLAPSDAFSPEPSRAKTPTTPLRRDLLASDSESDGAQSRVTLLPQPIKASTSPLRGTYVIRPRTPSSSSDDGDGENERLQTPLFKKELTESSSDAEIFPACSGQVRTPSPQSLSSIQPQEEEESEDELGSLDFRKQYQHISQLVSSKLPGYTM